MAQILGEFARSGLVNIVGGCCGTSPEHIRQIVEAVAPFPPRKLPADPHTLRLAGLEPCVIADDSLFVNVGERTNVTGSRKFSRLIVEKKYVEALEVAREHGTHQLMKKEFDFNGTPDKETFPANIEVASTTFDYHKLGGR